MTNYPLLLALFALSIFLISMTVGLMYGAALHKDENWLDELVGKALLVAYAMGLIACAWNVLALWMR